MSAYIRGLDPLCCHTLRCLLLRKAVSKQLHQGVNINQDQTGSEVIVFLIQYRRIMAEVGELLCADDG